MMKKKQMTANEGNTKEFTLNVDVGVIEVLELQPGLLNILNFQHYRIKAAAATLSSEYHRKNRMRMIQSPRTTFPKV